MTAARRARIGDIELGEGLPLVLIAGPCVIESVAMCLDVAEHVKTKADRLDVPFIFKASFDKANRTSGASFRGPGLEEGLAVLAQVKREMGVAVTTDVHEASQAARVAEVVDLLQVPAFLCRQTDLLAACARTGKPVNVKKGQFLAPWDAAHIVRKLRDAGCVDVLLTERGASFGYNRLVSDMSAIPIMQRTGCPVIYDVTHSVQLPGGEGERSGGAREVAPTLARAAAAAGADGFFIEVHPNPGEAKSDAATQVTPKELDELLETLVAIHEIVMKV